MYMYQSSHKQFLNSTPSIGCWMFGAFKVVLFPTGSCSNIRKQRKKFSKHGN